jgi:hemerythrin-like metal-binding protein
MYFKWEPEYVFGIKEIDDQHKYFVGLLDKMYEAILNNHSREELGEMLVSLINYAVKHFDTEEKYFDEFNYDGAAEHKLKHEELKNKVLDFQKKFLENKVDISFDLINFLEDWLVDHLCNLDKKYVECFHKNGLN